MDERAKLIAFYLPQYHPIPENDRWWGKGFTEWRNVAKSRPRFRGHYQPHIPADLGFYDLRRPQAQIEQAALAKCYGIDAFCYYHYWFNGKMLLEAPLRNLLTHPEIEMPFCICWANENWTRRWDGKDADILIQQDYDCYDPVVHARWLTKAFSDERYVRVHGKPLVIIYRPHHIKHLDEVVSAWKRTVKEGGFADIYLCAAATDEVKDNRLLGMGFDGIIDFQPSKVHPDRANKVDFAFYALKKIASRELSIKILSLFPFQFAKVFSYRRLAAREIAAPLQDAHIPCVMPAWDNSARRASDSTVIQNDDADAFGVWLESALVKVTRRPAGEQLVFLNAWNEWAEGCHLEPDLRNGHKFLEKIREVRKRHAAA